MILVLALVVLEFVVVDAGGGRDVNMPEFLKLFLPTELSPGLLPGILTRPLPVVLEDW